MDVNRKVWIKPDFLLEKLENEIVVYHPTLTKSMYFNETGALIWQLCDGTRTISEIIGLLESQYPESVTQIAPEVKTLIGQLLDQQVAYLE